MPGGSADRSSCKPQPRNTEVCDRSLVLWSGLSDVGVLQKLLFQIFQGTDIASVPEPMEIRDASALQVPPCASHRTARPGRAPCALCPATPRLAGAARRGTNVGRERPPWRHRQALPSGTQNRWRRIGRRHLRGVDSDAAHARGHRRPDDRQAKDQSVRHLRVRSGGAVACSGSRREQAGQSAGPAACQEIRRSPSARRSSSPARSRSGPAR